MDLQKSFVDYEKKVKQFEEFEAMNLYQNPIDASNVSRDLNDCHQIQDRMLHNLLESEAKKLIAKHLDKTDSAVQTEAEYVIHELKTEINVTHRDFNIYKDNFYQNTIIPQILSM